MRVLMVIDWNRGQGGAEAYAATLRAGLLAAGDEVRLLTSSAGTAADGTADYVALGTENRVAQAFLQIANPSAVQTVRRALQEFQPDAVWVNMFAHHLSPAALLALGDTPTVMLASDYKLVCPIGSKLRPDGSICDSQAGWVCRRVGCVGSMHWLRDRPRYALIGRAAARSRRTLACSNWVREELAAAGIESETIYLPAPQPPPAFRRQPAERPTVLYFGRLDVEKGVDLLIRAFARLLVEHPSARLEIAGRGPQRQQLEELAEACGARESIEFLGWMSPAQLDEPLSRAWATVAPSTWAEPLGLVAVESILRGAPPIVSATGGLAEIVEHGVNGLVFPNRDEDALLECLRQVAIGGVFPESSLAHAPVERARKRFGVEGHVRTMRRIFAEAVAEARA
jgi:glycosyltransferase involved in cell wall biosynthesis